MTLPLTAEQRSVVEHVRGALQVNAPAGTGKTAILSLRAARAVRQGVRPDEVLCLSFTNRACREMRARIEGDLSSGGERIAARTVHGFCAAVLRAEADRLGLPRDFGVADAEQVEATVRKAVAAQAKLAWDGGADRATRLCRQLFERLKVDFVPPVDDRDVRDRFARLRDCGAAAGVPADFDAARAFRDYQFCLLRDQTLDFGDLIARVRQLFASHPDALDRWRARCRWVQVDECQDLSPDQYRVLRELALPHGDIALFGDVDQAIYGWRHSDPRRLRAEFTRDFPGARFVALTRNFRSARAVVDAGLRVIRGCPGAVTAEVVCDRGAGGPPVVVRGHADAHDEVRAVADDVAAHVARPPASGAGVAVLCRYNALARRVSQELGRRGVDHLSVDQTAFFHRPEVRDLRACLAATVNPFDNASLVRVLGLTPFAIDPDDLAGLRRELPGRSMTLGDLVHPAAARGDPLLPLLDAWDRGKVVAFDTETTGLDPEEDRVIEVGAVRVGAGGERAPRFHRLVRGDVPPGRFAEAHGLTAELLEREGGSAAEALASFERFAQGCVLVGHNARFDLDMLAREASRCGGPLPAGLCYDTFDIVRRFRAYAQNTLEQVVAVLRGQIDLAEQPCHRALPDASATAAVLGYFVPELRRTSAARADIVCRHGPAFGPAAGVLARWRSNAARLPVPDFLEAVVADARLAGPAEGPPGARHQTLRELIELAAEDAGDRRGTPALVATLDLIALGSDGDRRFRKSGRVFVGTVHQAKGMEFDAVYVVGADDGAFPDRRSTEEGREDEEHRLFYVALTRARDRLVVTYSGNPSRYLRLLEG